MFSEKFLHSKRLGWIIAIVSIISYLLSLSIVSNDPYGTHRWLAFQLYIFSLLSLLYLYCVNSFFTIPFKKIFSPTEINPILLLTIITLVANFLLLPIYPYVSIADELRDGGLYGMDIATGIFTNIFGYGSYDAQGVIVSMVSIPFYYLFSNSVLTYRVPAALFSTLDVLLLYGVIRIFVNKNIAFWSALILATLPLHMFFAHTQMVIGLNFFWVPIVLLVLFYLLQKRRFIDYIFFGMLIGFVFGFHAAVRAFACVTLCVLLFLEAREMFIKKLRVREALSTRFAKLSLLILFIFIGFGPRVLLTNSQNFFHTSRFIFKNNIQSQTPLKTNAMTTLENNYVKSLMIYVYENASSFYPDQKPIFTPFLAIFFILGIGYAFFILKNFFLNILLFLIIVLPFFTSAITDWINASHRASPLLAISAVFVGVGITYCFSLIKNKLGKYLFSFILLLYICTQVFTFYTQQPANKNVPLSDYLSMHILYFLQADKKFQASPAKYLQDINSNNLSPVCLIVSPSNYHYYALSEATTEQNDYFLPSAAIHYFQNNSIKDNEVMILKQQCPKKNPFTEPRSTYTISCQKNKYVCPVDDKGTIIIHY